MDKQRVTNVLSEVLEYFVEQTVTNDSRGQNVAAKVAKLRADIDPVSSVRTFDGALVKAVMSDGGLSFNPTAEGREYLQEAKGDDEFHTDFFFLEMIEDMRANGFVEEVEPYQIGALTDALLLADSYDFLRDDQGNILHVGRLYKWQKYATLSPTESLLRHGHATFDAV